MRILIDTPAVERARLINRASYEDQRFYYLLDEGIVVCRGSLTLSALRGQVADASIGTDIAQIGFAAEEDVGKPRPKVTIYRALTGAPAETTLSRLLTRKPR